MTPPVPLSTSSSPLILDGRKAAHAWVKQLLPLTRAFIQSQDRPPGLAVLRVGNDPASLVYIHHKRRRAEVLGFHFEEHTLPETVSPEEVIQKIQALNAAPHIDGLILQLPLPHDVQKAFLQEGRDPLSFLDPHKDVDGLHPLNQGVLYSDRKPIFIPCTPLGCLYLLNHYSLSVTRKEACVIGRSVLVGKPLAALLLRENATVTVVHSHTPVPESITSRADFVFVAMGKKDIVTPSFFKKGAVVIDVGIHSQNGLIEGDVSPTVRAESDLSAISPVPGGVGPLTVMGLMHNTLKAAYTRCQMLFPLP